MAKRKKREEKPAKSNRGREDARGVFIVFEEQERAEDEPLARERGTSARREGEVPVDKTV
jgi:hypothetical protein